MKFSIVSVSFLVSVLFLTHASSRASVCPAPVPQCYKHVKPGNNVVAYFTNWEVYGKNKYDVKHMYSIADKLTHVVYAFAKPNPQTGMCELSDPWADVGANLEHRKKVAGNFAKLLELKRQFPHLKILLSVGGGTYSKDISEIVHKGLLSTFVRSCVDLLDRYEYRFKHSQTGEGMSHVFEYGDLFDGIDLDWEWLNHVVPTEESEAFESLIKQLRQYLDRRALYKHDRSMLTVALQVNSAVYNALPLNKVTPHVDWYHAMTYDFAGSGSGGTGFNAPLCNQWSSYCVDTSIAGLMSSGISPEKLVLGVPLYGQVFDKTTAKLGSAFEKTDITGAMSYDQIKKKYLNNVACKYKWHDKSSVPYVYCPDDKIFVSFDDEHSVKRKHEYARQKLLKGIVLWRLAGDDREHTLIKAIL